MVRLLRRAIALFTGYIAVMGAVVVAGFFAAAVGLWASVLWAVVVVGSVIVYLRRRTVQHEGQ